MRKALIIAFGAAVALVAAGVAMAAVFTATGVSTTTATFSADKVGEVKTRTCTGADGDAYEFTSGHYAGSMVSSNSALAGSLRIHAQTTYNTSDKVGFVEGSFRVKDDDSRVSGRFSGTLSDGKLSGFLSGTSRGSHAKVLGSISATFAGGTANFAAGQLGSGSSMTPLAVVAGTACKNSKPDRPARPVTVKGEVTALTASEITVTSKGPTTTKCAIGTGSPSTAGLLNKKVEMTCAYAGVAPNQAWTLTRLKLHD